MDPNAVKRLDEIAAEHAALNAEEDRIRVAMGPPAPQHQVRR
jgi:hypothetical protein